MAKQRKHGSGTVRLRSDGRWEGRVVIGYDDSGLPKTKNVLAKTKAECEKKLKSLIAAQKESEPQPPRQTMTAAQWLFTGNVTTTVILALAGIFGSVMMTTKDQSNLSVVDQVQNLIRFLRGQKIYPYRYGDEWGAPKARRPLWVHQR